MAVHRFRQAGIQSIELQPQMVQAMRAFELLCKTEGIIPAIESAHALAGAMEVGTELGPDALLLVNLSGRGDKDVHTAAHWFGLIDEEGNAQ